jgi:hypothetical protein
MRSIAGRSSAAGVSASVVRRNSEQLWAEERLSRIPAHSNARRVDDRKRHLLTTLMFGGAGFTKPALTIPSAFGTDQSGGLGTALLTNYFGRLVSGQGTRHAEKCRAIGQHPSAQARSWNRSHTHRKTSSSHQAPGATAFSCSFLHPCARKDTDCRQSQRRSCGRSIQAKYRGENRRVYSMGPSPVPPSASSTPWRHALRRLDGSSGHAVVFQPAIWKLPADCMRLGAASWTLG